MGGICKGVSIAWGEFHTSMTIKGVALQSDSTTKSVIPMDYAYIDANPWIRLRESSRDAVEKERTRVND